MPALRPGGAACRLVLALLWALVPWIASPAVSAAAGGHESCAPAARHSHHSTLAAADACPHCPGPDCAAGMHCEAGTTTVLPPPAGLVVGGPAERLAEGWLADRPLSSNPTPPTPPPPTAS